MPLNSSKSISKTASSLLKQIKKKVDMLEAAEKLRQLDGDLGTGDIETESQMFTIPRDYKDLTGELDGLLTKTRFDDNQDVGFTLEPIILRQYMGLERTRYGGSHKFLPIEDIENGAIDIDEYQGFEFWPDPIKVNGKICVEVFIDINAVRTRVNLKGRIASLGGKARIEKIHDSASRAQGQAYVEQHVPPPNIYVPGYKAPKKVKAVEVADAMLEGEE